MLNKINNHQIFKQHLIFKNNKRCFKQIINKIKFSKVLLKIINLHFCHFNRIIKHNKILIKDKYNKINLLIIKIYNSNNLFSKILFINRIFKIIFNRILYNNKNMNIYNQILSVIKLMIHKNRIINLK